MSDGYIDFANSGLGAKLVNMLGLPKPLPLERFQAGQPVIQGPVLVGGGAQAPLLSALAKVFKAIGAQTLAHERLPQWVSVANQAGLTTGRWGGAGKGGEKVKALVFDATGLTDSTQSDALYWFFHDAARSLLPCGRVIVLGRPPEGCASPRQATVQRALEGLTRSLGKELKKGSNAQLVYVAEGADDQIESTLRFLLSPRSAYVSAQVIRIGQVVGTQQAPTDWQQALAGKKVLVTGASRGIGAAIAEVMARDGAQVICLDVPQAQAGLDEVAKKIGGTSLALDIGAPEAPQKLVDAAKAQGGWDVIVHNAGITRDKTIANMKPEIWQLVVNVNLSTQERINEAMVESGALKAGGRIVCVSSISGIAGNMGQTNYAVSKAGVIGMVQSTAPLFAKHGITINAVAPGFIETQMTAAIPFAIREAGRRMNSMSQGGLPVDVAEAIGWFASPASSGITGNVVRVCGQSLIGA
ncbi:3-oxoacyl-ACP reductase [Aquabacterium sp.]|uniref:3-oxoacyl-ACP reductase n=1 Tax=Aquabacterium sp. TaxID=1872578 RepID=UPI0027BAA4D3|nr:3-oxoacyl-ACP reductase [Aquabacterium sp.]